MTVYLNADIGEGSPYDAELLPFLKYVNIACGGHAGGGAIMANAIKSAIDNSVFIGAHPSYPDIENFGRISKRGELSNKEISSSVSAQLINFLEALQEYQGQQIHIKAHGALYNDSSKFEDIALAYLEGINTAIDTRGIGRSTISIMVQPNTLVEKQATAAGYKIIREGFIDRRYTDDGLLTSRNESGSVLESYEEVERQVLGFAKYGFIITNSGKQFPIIVDTLCIHSDTPGCVELAKIADSILEMKEKTNDI
jgi:UPF0271 protein